VRYTATIVATPPNRLVDKISRLPQERLAEVEAFVDSLSERDPERQIVRAAEAMSEAAFGQVWSNPEDDVYDAL